MTQPFNVVGLGESLLNRTSLPQQAGIAPLRTFLYFPSREVRL